MNGEVACNKIALPENGTDPEPPLGLKSTIATGLPWYSDVFIEPNSFGIADELPGLKSFHTSTFAPLLAVYVSTPEYIALSVLGIKIAAT